MIQFLLISFLVSIVFNGTAVAISEEKWPDVLNDPINKLLQLSDPKNNQSVSIEAYTPLLSFVSDTSNSNKIIYTGGEAKNPSAFYSFDIQRSLEQIIQYGFNPKIPSVLLRPSSLRLSYWSEVEGKKQDLPELWQYLSDLTSPVVVRGVEHIEITPDTNSKTYFSYDMDRIFILFKYQKRRVMISLSGLKDKSEVGKKGLILGPDENWDYVYTGEKGVNKSGLGWVRSRIYSSNNIMIFYESENDENLVRCAVFNWIKAGWAGINMVNNEHIYYGILRFAHNFKEIIELSTLPAPDELVRQMARFQEMTTEELRKRTGIYLKQLGHKYAKTEKQLAELLDDPNYINTLKREEMMNLLVREYAKVLIGKESANQAEYLSGTLTTIK